MHKDQKILLTRRQKKILFVCIALILLSVPMLMASGFYLYKKLTFSFEIGPKFSRFDDELGWTLKPNAKSHLRGRSLITGEVYFDSEVFTDSRGFRIGRNPPSLQESSNTIVAIGDSWTFGYCVDYEETYPFHLERLAETRTVNLGVPGYGNGSTYGLFKRHVGELEPKYVVYLSQGLWSRSFQLDNKESKEILVPTFFYDDLSEQALLKYPQPNFVTASVDKGNYPGGSLTAGYNFFNYLRYVKAPQIVDLARSTLVSLLPANSQPNIRAGNDQSAMFYGDSLDAVLDLEVTLYGNLALEHGFTLLFIVQPFPQLKDQTPFYYESSIDKFVSKNPDADIRYISPKVFQEEVLDKANELGMAENDQYVPQDGHYGPGMNKLIANMVFDELF